MNTKEIVMEIKNRFELALEAKSGWGKNEIKAVYDNIVIEVLSEQL